jgi:hypothetical protein
LREVEKRLTARIANIARSQAAALADTAESRIIRRNPAPDIKHGLLGAIPFEDDALVPTEAGAARIAAVAHLLHELPGRIDIVVRANGTGGTFFDVASTRARRVYLRLLEAEPRLAERELRLTVRTQHVLPGAPVPDPVVEVYYSAP